MKVEAPMRQERPQINVSKIVIGGGAAGAIFAIGSMLIFLTGLPMLRYFFAGAIVLGCLVALMLRLLRRETPGTPWINSTAAANAPEIRKDDSRDLPDHQGHTWIALPAKSA
jgi:hypothetical protein